MHCGRSAHPLEERAVLQLLASSSTEVRKQFYFTDAFFIIIRKEVKQFIALGRTYPSSLTTKKSNCI